MRLVQAVALAEVPAHGTGRGPRWNRTAAGARRIGIPIPVPYDRPPPVRRPPMSVPPLVWQLTVALLAGLVAYDFFFHVRKAHVPSLKEAALWSALYVGIALLFGVGVVVFGGANAGAEYFAGYVTEKALSIDNVFVFLVIMASFKVPRQDQQKVLLFGIVFALIARTGFIFLGAALTERFAWVF
jgi:tellurite resistance protein TerC